MSDDPVIDGALWYSRDGIRKAIAEHGAPDFGATLQLVAAAEGVPPETWTEWAQGFLSCLDYVRADPEMTAAMARWWRETGMSVEPENLPLADAETAVGAAIMAEALLGRPGALG